MPKIVNFGESLNTWSLRSNSVTRQVTFKRTKTGGKCQNLKTSNETFSMIFKHSTTLGQTLNFRAKISNLNYYTKSISASVWGLSFISQAAKLCTFLLFLRLHSITLWTQNWGLFSYFQCSSQAYQSRWLKAPNFAFPWDLSLQMNVTSQGTFNPFSRTIRHSPRREQSRKNEIWKFSPPSPF